MKYIEGYKNKKINLNQKNMYVVMDFDGTITNYIHSDSWNVAGKELAPEFNKEITNLYNKYRPIELDYKIDYEEKCNAMEMWYKECMDLYYKYGLTIDKLKTSINNSEPNFRQGVNTFFNYMHNNEIPIIILSAGIGNVIEGSLKKNNCYYDNMYIISNFIKFDSEGKMIKFDDDMIDSMNKNLNKSKLGNWNKKIENRKYKLLLGDLVEDKNMVDKSEWDTTISIGFIEKNIENLPIFEKNFDIVLSNEDANYNSVMEILKFEA